MQSRISALGEYSACASPRWSPFAVPHQCHPILVVSLDRSPSTSFVSTKTLKLRLSEDKRDTIQPIPRRAHREYTDRIRYLCCMKRNPLESQRTLIILDRYGESQLPINKHAALCRTASGAVGDCSSITTDSQALLILGFSRVSSSTTYNIYLLEIANVRNGRSGDSGSNRFKVFAVGSSLSSQTDAAYLISNSRMRWVVITLHAGTLIFVSNTDHRGLQSGIVLERCMRTWLVRI